MQYIVNAQGLNMSKLDLGTWPMLGEECTRAVEQALALGYRHIDTAAAYNNEDAVGKALANSPTPREQIYVTTNVWWDRSLKALRSEYVDLFMLHWPTTDWDLPRTIETLASFKEQGLARNIGVAKSRRPSLDRQPVQTRASGQPGLCAGVGRVRPATTHLATRDPRHPS